MSFSHLRKFQGDFGRLVSPVPDRNLPRYSWYAFKHSYSKKLVVNLLNEFGVGEGGWVLDPFCGGGTTLLACREAGVNSIGYDILPFSVFISNTKSEHFNTNALKRDFSTFKLSATKSHFPDVAIMEKAFTPSVRDALLQIRAWIGSLEDKRSRDFFLLALLSILDKVSKAKKSGGFLRLVNKRYVGKQAVALFKSTAEKMINDLDPSTLHKGTSREARIGDARKMRTKKLFDAVITSPPYPNRHDYTRVYALELLASFTDSNDSLKELRYDTLRSHVEARLRFPTEEYVPPNALSDIIDELEEKELNNNQIVPMLSGYFEDMYLVMKEIKRCLNEDGKAAVVVSNVRYAGINVPVDEILAEAGEQAGLTPTEIRIARNRGNSSQQMAKYSRDPSRESIVILGNH